MPALYTKLITVDKVDLLVGPYATNMVAPAMPVIMQHNKMTISILGLGVNQQFGNYPRYFSTVPLGPDGPPAFSQGLLRARHGAEPETADGRHRGGRRRVRQDRDRTGRASTPRQSGLTIVYDAKYPPSTTDFTPVMRAVQAANPDIVFAAAYPPDTVGIVRAANEIGLAPKIFGGTLIGLTATPIKMQLGPLVNGIIINESFLPTLELPRHRRADAEVSGQGAGPRHRSARLRVRAVRLRGRTVARQSRRGDQAASTTTSSPPISTTTRWTPWSGPLAFGADGEWTQSRIVFTQFQNVTGNDLGQFKDPAKEVILWPAKFKNGTMIYPYADAKKK